MKAIIFDIDGTLAKNNTRGHFEWDKVSEDSVNIPIMNMLDAYVNMGYRILILSGRDEVCLEDTKKWLKDNGIIYDLLLLREKGNKEKDVVIKRRMYEQIENEYSIELVVEDRDQVVKMYRDLGLTCVQVDYGNF